MKFIIFLALLVQVSFAQVYVRGSMGLNYVNMSSVRDYLNPNFAPADQQLSSFNSAVEFSSEAGWHPSEGLDIALEVAYEFSNFNYSTPYFQYNFDYNIYKPSVVIYKRIDGDGYFFRYGIGAGPRFTMVEETLPPINKATKFTSTGFGMLLVANGNSMLAVNTYIYLTGDLRYDFNGEPENDKGEKILYNAKSATLDMKSLSAGIKLGLTYIF